MGGVLYESVKSWLLLQWKVSRSMMFPPQKENQEYSGFGTFPTPGVCIKHWIMYVNALFGSWGSLCKSIPDSTNCRIQCKSSRIYTVRLLLMFSDWMKVYCFVLKVENICYKSFRHNVSSVTKFVFVTQLLVNSSGRVCLTALCFAPTEVTWNRLC